MPDSIAAQLNIKGKDKNSYDAIVIGSGISGGWAAKELCEQGLKTLVFERGRDVVHVKDYPTAFKDPWEFPHRGRMTHRMDKENPIVSRCYAFDEATAHFFVKDKEHPYIQEKPFDWIRGYQVGGKSLIWARETQRWSHFEFEAPARDEYGIAWPIGYEDLAPWYSHVELFAGICGSNDGIENMPDGELLPPWELNCVEKDIQRKINDHYIDRRMVVGRCAHLTKPTKLHIEQNRGQCMARDLCARGCPYGAYFSSNASTIPWAQKTGNLTIRPNSIVHSIIYDDQKDKAIGVRVIDALTKKMTDYFARIIFVNAACLNSNLLLLNSISKRFPNGLGNDNGLLGHYVTFHNYRPSMSGTIEGFDNTYYYGRRPSSPIIPSFRNVHRHEMDFLAGYMTFVNAIRAQTSNATDNDIGVEYKNRLIEPGPWIVSMSMQGETIPKYENHVRLSPDKKDEWGIPQLIISVGYDENDEKMIKDFFEQGSEMLSVAGCKNIVTNDSKQAPGLDIHEMGGIRMGKDPKTSLLNKWNQLHSVPNVFVTDGACMTSTGFQNPSLTFMALTARAANHAIQEFKNGNL